jgi:hypothetical protein
MKERFIKPAVLILLAVSACLFQSCCKDCPTAPQPPPLGEYRLYAYDNLSQLIMAFDTPADTLVDSVRIDYYSYRIFLTPDEDRLLVPHRDNRCTEIYRASDLSHIGSIAQHGDYYFDKTDNIAVFYGLDSTIYFIDPVSLTPFDSITGFPLLGDFYIDTVSNFLYCPAYLENWIYIIDYNNRLLADSVDVGGHAYSVIYSRLTNEFYFHTKITPVSGFYRFDIDTDSLHLITYTTSPFGSVSLSPDVGTVYMTDGGHGFFGIEPRGDVWVYDPFEHKVITIIPPTPFLDISDPGSKCFGTILITPDNRRAYVGGNPNSAGGVPLAVVDLASNRMIHKIKPYSYFYAISIALGPKINIEPED